MELRVLTFYVATIFIALVAIPVNAQVLPDTTNLLKEAGVNPTELNTQKKGSYNKLSKESSVNRYDLPIASNDNVLELSVINTTNREQQALVVQVIKAPGWLTFNNRQLKITELTSGASAKVKFRFDVNKKARIGGLGRVIIKAKDSNGMIWSKQLFLKVTAPTKFKLMQNYPNPFSPTTTIAYLLPAEMKVKVIIYNILGRKVATLADEVQEAGRQELDWNASGMASGIYIYRVIADAENGEEIIRQRKMMLIK